MSIAPLRIYDTTNFGGTEYSFTDSILGQTVSFASSGITLSGSFFSIKVEPGYRLMLSTETSQTMPTGGGEYSSVPTTISTPFGIQSFTSFRLEKIVATITSNGTLYYFFTGQITSSLVNLSTIIPTNWGSSFSSITVSSGYVLTLEDQNLGTLTFSQAGSPYSNVSVSSRFTSEMQPIQYKLEVSAPAPEPSPAGWKRSKLNLYDAATKSLHLELNQFDSSTQLNFPTNLNFTNGTTTILDVIDYLERVVSVENDIGLLQGRADVNESDIDVLEGRMDVNESDIDALEGRASTNEADLVVLDERADSNASRLLTDDAQLDVVESDIDALEARASVIEADIDALEGRADVNESDLVVLDERADSNASRLLADDAQMDVVESDIDALEGRASVNEADIDALEGRADVNESDLVVLDERADSNASRLLADDAQLDVVESDIDALEGRMSTAEVDIVDLENSFTNYEADVVEIKGTLYAITDGNIESMLSSLHEITDSFASETNSAEDMAELNARLAELESVIQELTETM